MTVRAAPPWIAEAAEIVVQEVEQLVDRERVESRRGELDRQRHAVEQSDESDDVLEFGVVSSEVPANDPCPVDEQVHGGAARFGRQRRHSDHLLPAHAERGAAGRQEGRCRAARGDVFDERGGSVEHVLAVVQHDQRRHRAQRRLDAGEERRRLPDTERLGSDRWNVVTGGGERQGDEPHRQRGSRRSSGGEPGLADTSWSDERHDVASNEPIADGRNGRGTPHE